MSDVNVSIAEKVAHVRRQRDTGGHHCHWPGCTKHVPPAKWGCLPHWNALPRDLRDRIWQTYRPGQEISKTPSAAYIQVARDVQAWIAAQTPAAAPAAPQLTLEGFA